MKPTDQDIINVTDWIDEQRQLDEEEQLHSPDLSDSTNISPKEEKRVTKYMQEKMEEK